MEVVGVNTHKPPHTKRDVVSNSRISKLNITLFLCKNKSAGDARATKMWKLFATTTTTHKKSRTAKNIVPKYICFGIMKLRLKLSLASEIASLSFHKPKTWNWSANNSNHSQPTRKQSVLVNILRFVVFLFHCLRSSPISLHYGEIIKGFKFE